MVRRTSDWRDELGRWLKPFLDRLGHKARRQMCPLYVSGLIGPGDRKSVQPMAKRLALGACDQLHHFIAAGVWDATPVETELLAQADRLVGGSDAVLVIDDTAIPKKGTHSVGVAAQYASALGKTANCQNPGIADAGARRSAGRTGVAVVSSRELDEQAVSVGASGCSGRMSNGTNETGNGSGGDRSCHRGRCALWLRVGGCRLWAERAVPRGSQLANLLGQSVFRGTSRCTLPIEEILSRQPAGEGRPAHLSNHHQGTLGLRAGSPADVRRAWS